MPQEKMRAPKSGKDIKNEMEIETETVRGTEEFEQNDMEEPRSIEVTSIEKIGEAFNGPYMETFCKEVASGKSFQEADEKAKMAAVLYEAAEIKRGTTNWRTNRNAEVYGDSTMVYRSNSGRAYTIIRNADGSFGLHFYGDNSRLRDFLEALN